MIILVEGKKVSLKKQDDGWYEGDGYAVNPEKDFCQTYPWTADFIAEAPEHKFEIIEKV